MKNKLKRWKEKLKSERDKLKSGLNFLKVDDMGGKRGGNGCDFLQKNRKGNNV